MLPNSNNNGTLASYSFAHLKLAIDFFQLDEPFGVGVFRATFHVFIEAQAVAQVEDVTNEVEFVAAWTLADCERDDLQVLHGLQTNTNVHI